MQGDWTADSGGMLQGILILIAVVIGNRIMSAIASEKQTESIVGGIAMMKWGDSSIDPTTKSMAYLSKVEV